MDNEFEKKFSELGGIVPIGDAFVPADDAELNEIEAAVEGSFPSEFRLFVKKYGASAFAEYVGYHPIQPLPPEISSTGKGLFSCFYGGNNARHNSLARKIEQFRGRMPETIIPIGGVSANQICIGIKGDELGRIYLWDHENDPDEDDYLEEFGVQMPPEAKFQNIYPIAESFVDFIRRIEKWENV